MGILDTIKALGDWFRNLVSKRTSQEVSPGNKHNSTDVFVSMGDVEQPHDDNISIHSDISSDHVNYRFNSYMRSNSSMSLESIGSTLSEEGSNQTQIVTRIFDNAIVSTDSPESIQAKQQEQAALQAISSLEDISDINTLEENINSYLNNNQKVYNPVVIVALCQRLQTISSDMKDENMTEEDMVSKRKLSAIIEKLQIQPVKQIFDNAIVSTDSPKKEQAELALRAIERFSLYETSDIKKLEEYINHYFDDKQKVYNPLVITKLLDKLKIICSGNTITDTNRTQLSAIIDNLQKQQTIRQIFENAISTNADTLNGFKSKENKALENIEQLVLNDIDDIKKLQGYISHYLNDKQKVYNPVVIAKLCEKLQSIMRDNTSNDTDKEQQLSAIINNLLKFCNEQTSIIETLKNNLQKGQLAANKNVDDEWMYQLEAAKVTELTKGQLQCLDQYIALCNKSITKMQTLQQESNSMAVSTTQRRNI